MQNRWITLLIIAMVCWMGATACHGGGGVPGGPTPVPGPGESVPVPKSLFIPVTSGEETQVYRVDIEPAEDLGGDVQKLIKADGKPKFRGYQAKAPAVAQNKYNPFMTALVGITPFNELVVSCDSSMVADGPPCLSWQARLIGKDTSVDILKNRKLMGFFGPMYDGVGDRLLFVEVAEGEVRRLIQRTMDGKETVLYQDKNLIVMPSINQVMYLFEGKGVFTLSLSDGKLTKLLDTSSIYGMEVVDHKGGYVLFRKKDQSLLVKSDGSKSYDLPTGAKAKLLRSDLNELVFTADATEAAPSGKMTPTSNKTKSLHRLDLQTGTVTTLLKTSDITQVIDHVGDQYLVATFKHPDAVQYVVQLSWLKPDGSLQDIGGVTTGQMGMVVSYNASHQVVAVQDGDLRINLVSVKDGKVIATLDNTFMRPTFIFPTESGVSVILTFQKTDAPGVFNVGLISPDTLGSKEGTDFGLVSLGTIDTKQPVATVASLILNTDIHDAKTRTPAAVADTTPPPTPAGEGTSGNGGGDGGPVGGGSKPPKILALPSVETPVFSGGSGYVKFTISTDTAAPAKITVTCDKNFNFSEILNIPGKQGMYAQDIQTITVTLDGKYPEKVNGTTVTLDYEVNIKAVTDKISCNVSAVNDGGNAQALFQFVITSGKPPAVSPALTPTKVSKGGVVTIPNVTVTSEVGFDYVQFFCPTGSVSIKPSVPFDKTANAHKYVFDLTVGATMDIAYNPPKSPGIACAVSAKDLANQSQQWNIIIYTQ